MIHNFKVENFYSIYNEQELDFTSSKQYGNSATPYNNYFVSNVNCFVGANASGKTNIFKALSFLVWYTEDSFYDITDSSAQIFDAHKLHEDEPTKFTVIFDSNKKLYRYYLEFLKGQLTKEILEIESQKGFSYIYKLTQNEGNIDILYNRNNKILDKINSNEEKRFKSKGNVTFFSFLRGTGYLKQIDLEGISQDSFSNVSNIGLRSYDNYSESIFLSKILDEEAKQILLPYIQCFDFGITDFDKPFTLQFKDGEEEKIIGFKHSNGEKQFTLSAFDESAGTIKGAYLTLLLLKLLNSGGVAIVDELDVRLHYDIARKLVSLFSNKETNPQNAQLFFSSHQPLFLNDRDKKQIFLCAKDDYINTEIYRLDDVEGVRNTENFFENYLAGSYGATPRIGDCI